MPFIFNSLREAIFVFNISWCGVIIEECAGVEVTSASGVVGRAFIAFLAYTYWLDLSRDKLSFADFHP